MVRDITLGQFFPGESILHKIDPRMKILLSIAYIVAVFLAKSAIAYALVGFITLMLAIISGISFRTLIKSLRPLILIIVIMLIVNVFFYSGTKTEPLASFWIINIYKEGLINAGYMIVRIICMIMGASVILTYTTSPIALTDGLEQLLMPLSKIKLPVHEFSMMMTIALRFVPTIIEETDKIIQAQKSRGADFESGNLIRRLKAFIPILIPLFVSSFKRADELATAMECRCYKGGNGRTKMKKLKFTYLDLLALLFIALFITGVVLINVYYPVWVL